MTGLLDGCLHYVSGVIFLWQKCEQQLHDEHPLRSNMDMACYRAYYDTSFQGTVRNTLFGSFFFDALSFLLIHDLQHAANLCSVPSLFLHYGSLGGNLGS